MSFFFDRNSRNARDVIWFFDFIFFFVVYMFFFINFNLVALTEEYIYFLIFFFFILLFFRKFISIFSLNLFNSKFFFNLKKKFLDGIYSLLTCLGFNFKIKLVVL